MAYNDDSSWRKPDSWRKRDTPDDPKADWGRRPPTRSFQRPSSPPTEPIEFSKNFYTPPLKKMSVDEVREFRHAAEMRVQGDGIPAPVDAFDALGFPDDFLKIFRDRGYGRPTPIQAQGWPMALSGRDMVGIAQTGSGKTLSFAVPALVHAKAQPPLRRGDGPIALILAPTRELCIQICDEVDVFAKKVGLDCAAVYGGAPAVPQKNLLARGVAVLVATPGRLIDLHEQGYCPLTRVTFLVLDEADRMLDMGFKPQLEKIIPRTNPGRQTLMWSATWPTEVKSLARDYTTDPIQVNIGSDQLAANSLINQKVIVMDQYDKKRNLAEVLKNESGRVIIFCNMKRTCDEIEDLLSRDYRCAAIHGDKTQMAREKIIGDFKRGSKNVLIATDVAARGLDVKDVKLVINYDFPNSCDDYVHRVGRTARGNEKEGFAVTFFTFNDASNARELIGIIRSAKQDVPEELMRMSSSGSGGRRNFRYGGRRY